MSITQERVIAIINAGLDFKQALDRTIQLIDDEYARYSKRDDIPPFLIALYTHCSHIRLLEHPQQSPVTLATEAKHFRSNWRRNQRNAAKAERRRREAGSQPRQPASNDPFIYPVSQSPAPRLDMAFASRPGSSFISPERQRQIEAEAEASARKWHPELFANEATQKPVEQSLASQMGEAYDPDDLENAMTDDAGIAPAEAGTDEIK